ncbi:hypothetical protein B0H67DRAFT_641182 [Lasiosphaeris hirsuta]|uniref:Uncharacterized protein n=1 Tax=Lasiosphaeris hirsuta TaxID=260670 RepID=A0AA40E2J2_9PEZI|nr:hypothetical protein B0H67DRAFT_641182 [Lasiosphaeris hirsuta]
MDNSTIVRSMAVILESKCQCRKNFGQDMEMALSSILRYFEGAVMGGYFFTEAEPKNPQIFVAVIAFADLTTTVDGSDEILEAIESRVPCKVSFKSRETTSAELALQNQAMLELVIFVRNLESVVLDSMLQYADAGGSYSRVGVSFDQIRRVLGIHDYV